MERICSQCHAVLAEETKADWCPACGGALVERRSLPESGGLGGWAGRAGRLRKWIIAASCCRGGTRKAGLSRRSKVNCPRRVASRLGAYVETDRLGQLCLALIEGPEFVGP